MYATFIFKVQEECYHCVISYLISLSCKNKRNASTVVLLIFMHVNGCYNPREMQLSQQINVVLSVRDFSGTIGYLHAEGVEKAVGLPASVV